MFSKKWLLVTFWGKKWLLEASQEKSDQVTKKWPNGMPRFSPMFHLPFGLKISFLLILLTHYLYRWFSIFLYFSSFLSFFFHHLKLLLHIRIPLFPIFYLIILSHSIPLLSSLLLHFFLSSLVKNSFCVWNIWWIHDWTSHFIDHHWRNPDRINVCYFVTNGILNFSLNEVQSLVCIVYTFLGFV